MTVVLVSQRVDRIHDRDETRDALDQRLIAFLSLAGCLPVPVPNGLGRISSEGQLDHAELDRWVGSIGPQAVVLSGGNNIGQYTMRDATETFLLDHAKRHRWPVLGICRGMQMMASWAGGNLRRVEGHVRTRHHLCGEIAGAVNSYHDFSLTNCPSGFDVLGRSEDGEIEAIRHRSLPWEGWMWHPEREASFAARDVDRLQMLLAGQEPKRDD